jgi:hypothetical protein
MNNQRPWVEYFFQAVREKMDRGQSEHGDGALERDPSELIEEIMEECVDIAGWGSIAWMRLAELSCDIREYEERLARLRSIERTKNGEDAKQDAEVKQAEKVPVVGDEVVKPV